MIRTIDMLMVVILITLTSCSTPTASIPTSTTISTPASVSITTAASTSTAEGNSSIVTVLGGSYTNITLDQLQTMLEHKDFTLLNVYGPSEGIIPGTDLNITTYFLKDKLDQLPDKNAKIVVYCYSGSQSKAAAEFLVSQGYTQVYRFGGGIQAWDGAGLQLINKP